MSLSFRTDRQSDCFPENRTSREGASREQGVPQGGDAGHNGPTPQQIGIERTPFLTGERLATLSPMRWRPRSGKTHPIG